MPRWLWLDMLGKVQEEVVVRTTSSSIGLSLRDLPCLTRIVTVIAWIAIISAIVGETHYYLTPEPLAEVSIDRTGLQHMDIDFKILLPDLPCNNFGVDALDSSGAADARASSRSQSLQETCC